MIRRIPRWLVIAVAIVLVLRAALPFAIERYGEYVIDLSEVYTGQIDDVDVALWRASLDLNDVVVSKRNGRVAEPLFRCPRIHISLIPGARAGAMELEQPQVHLVVAADPAASQTGLDADWSETAKRIEPLHLDRVVVKDAAIHFRGARTKPSVDLVVLKHLDLAAVNLKNTEHIDDRRVARVALRATPMQSGRLQAKARFIPGADPPDFDLDAHVVDANIADANNLLRARLDLDVEKGRFSTDLALDAKDGRVRGYVQPVVEELDVVSTEEAKEQSPLQNFWQGLIDATAAVFENPRDEKVSARIPISGSIENPKAGVWPAIGSLVGNAFFEGLPPLHASSPD